MHGCLHRAATRTAPRMATTSHHRHQLSRCTNRPGCRGPVGIFCDNGVSDVEGWLKQLIGRVPRRTDCLSIEALPRGRKGGIRLRSEPKRLTEVGSYTSDTGALEADSHLLAESVHSLFARLANGVLDKSSWSEINAVCILHSHGFFLIIMTTKGHPTSNSPRASFSPISSVTFPTNLSTISPSTGPFPFLFASSGWAS